MIYGDFMSSLLSGACVLFILLAIALVGLFKLLRSNSTAGSIARNSAGNLLSKWFRK